VQSTADDESVSVSQKVVVNTSTRTYPRVLPLIYTATIPFTFQFVSVINYTTQQKTESKTKTVQAECRLYAHCNHEHTTDTLLGPIDTHWVFYEPQRRRLEIL